MTERLYYADSSLLKFEATITASGKEGEQHYTVLDRTAFYPTSGGQLYDTGFLNNIPVVDVIETDDGDIRHLSANPVGNAGEAVKGSIDKIRRLKHRQQHTAQHVLSQLFVRQLGFATVSVHLGEEYGAIELDSEDISPEVLAEVERAAAEIIFDNEPVEILTVDEANIDSVPLRRVPKKKGKIRVIKIDDFDYSACGGTHCRSTSEIGLVKIIGTEKIRGRVLVKFLAGIQAVNDYGLRFVVSDQISQSLTCHVKDVPERLAKITGEVRDLRLEVTRLQKEMLPVAAARLAADARDVNGVKFVFEAVQGYDGKTAGYLATETAQQTGGVAVLHLEGRLVIAAAENSGREAGKLAAELVRAEGLKGGGNPRLANVGGVTPEKLAEYQQFIESLL